MAESGADAIQRAADFRPDIAVLLADFQMKGMTGIELATKLTASRPAIKVLLMSDFPTGTLVLNDGWHFLPKPFVFSQLSALMTTLAEPHKAPFFAQ
jgi:CheY-like chemotaxis protein